MPLQPLPGFTIPGYTNVNVAGSQSLTTEVLDSVNLSAGDYVLTKEQCATVGIIEVGQGHATNAVVVMPTVGSMFFLFNRSGTTANIKVPSGTAITIASTKAASVYVTSSLQLQRLTADA